MQKEAQQLLEVHGGSAEQGVDAIANRTFEPVSLKSVFAFHVPDGRFNGCAAFHPPPKAFRRRASTAFVDVYCLWSDVVVAPIAHVDVASGVGLFL